MRSKFLPLGFLLCLLLTIAPTFAQEATEEPAKPTDIPVVEPTKVVEPTSEITAEPTVAPTIEPTAEPTLEVTPEVTPETTIAPTLEVTPEVTPETTVEPTVEVTPEITAEPTAEVASVERVINYNPNSSEAAIQAMLAQVGAVELERIPQIGAIKVLLPAGVADPSDFLAALSQNASALSINVTNIEPDVTDYQLAAFIPNDPLFANAGQWGFKTNFGSYATTAWENSPRDGQGIIIAVIDSGVRATHPDLAGQLVAGWDFLDDDNNPDDTDINFNHGTHVTGILVAKTNNALGVAGMAFKAKVMPLRVADGVNGISAYNIAQSIIFAVDRGAKVINLSLRSYNPSTTIAAAVDYAVSRNVTVVAAAGNELDITRPYAYPASFPGVISVASHDVSGVKQINSTSNDRITVSAPGVGIYSTAFNDTPTTDDDYRMLTGTSMASPHVAGIVALLYADGKVTNAYQAAEALICSARDADGDPDEDADPTTRDNNYGNGYVRADRALSWYSNGSGCQPPQTNDLIERATAITRFPATIVQPFQLRSVTPDPSDPDFCREAGDVEPYPDSQLLWYSLKTTVSDFYQITTIGSSFDTVIGLFQGSKGVMEQIACADDVWGGTHPILQSALVAELKAGQTYYLAVRGFDNDSGADETYDDEILRLDIRRIIASLGRDLQETDAGIAYPGTWVRTRITGASGSYTMQTSDFNAYAVFSFRGNHLDLWRTTGPLFGDSIVYALKSTGALQTFYSNRGAFQLANTQVTDTDFINENYPGELFTVIVRRNPSASAAAGSIDLDRFRVYEGAVPTSAITSLTDDRVTTKFIYSGGWSPLTIPGTYKNTVYTTSTDGATVTFRVTGSTLTLYRTIGPTYGTSRITIDGVEYDPISNVNPTTAYNVPYVITGLAPITHVVRITNDAASTLQIDAVAGSSPKVLAAGFTTYDDRNSSLVYSGLWTNTADPNAAFRTTRTTNQANGARASFSFTGNYFCIGYVQQPGGGTFDIHLDDFSIAVGDPFFNDFSTAGDLAYAEFCSPFLLNDFQHRVEIVPTGSVTLDYVWLYRIPVLTASSGLPAENNAAFTYYLGDDFNPSVWTSSTLASAAGYKFQGSRAYVTTADTASLDFYMSGTGFVLYTAVGPTEGEWLVTVDGVPYTFTTYGVDLPTINLNDEYPTLAGGDRTRFSPFAIAINGLPAGLHRVVLEAITPGGQRVHFDGVRIIP